MRLFCLGCEIAPMFNLPKGVSAGRCPRQMRCIGQLTRSVEVVTNRGSCVPGLSQEANRWRELAGIVRSLKASSSRCGDGGPSLRLESYRSERDS